MVSRSVDAMGRDPPAELEQHRRLWFWRHHAPDEHVRRPLVGEAPGVLDVDGVRCDVEADDPADRLAGDGHADLVAAAYVMLLRRKHVAMNGLARSAADGSLKVEARERRALVLIVLERQFQQTKVFPPRRLLL